MIFEINWRASVDSENKKKLDHLQDKLIRYYNEQKYYSYIQESTSKWIDKSYLPFQKILQELTNAKNILEIGCGEAALLNHYPEMEPLYTGIEFSKELLNLNRSNYPKADFRQIADAGKLDFSNNSFDFIFSVFVLEHVVYPARLLEEMVRVLKPGGKLIIFCPDYLGHNWMASQRTGYTMLSGREKLKKGMILDALITAIYNKFLLPLYCSKCRAEADKIPRFLINLNPICFEEDKFQPDVDAVYVTYEKEIKKFLSDRITWQSPDENLEKFLHARRLIMLTGIKK